MTRLGRWPRLHTLHGHRPHPRAIVAHAAILHALASKPLTALPRAAPASSAAGRTSTRRRRPRLHSTGRTSGGPPAFAVAGTGPLLPSPVQPYCPSTRRFPPRTGGSGCRVGGSSRTYPQPPCLMSHEDGCLTPPETAASRHLRSGQRVPSRQARWGSHRCAVSIIALYHPLSMLEPGGKPRPAAAVLARRAFSGGSL